MGGEGSTFKPLKHASGFGPENKKTNPSPVQLLAKGVSHNRDDFINQVSSTIREKFQRAPQARQTIGV